MAFSYRFSNLVELAHRKLYSSLALATPNPSFTVQTLEFSPDILFFRKA